MRLTRLGRVVRVVHRILPVSRLRDRLARVCGSLSVGAASAAEEAADGVANGGAYCYATIPALVSNDSLFCGRGEGGLRSGTSHLPEQAGAFALLLLRGLLGRGRAGDGGGLTGLGRLLGGWALGGGGAFRRWGGAAGLARHGCGGGGGCCGGGIELFGRVLDCWLEREG